MSNKPHRKAPVAPSRTSKTTLHRRGLSLNHVQSGTSSRSASRSRWSTGLDQGPEASEDEMAGLPQFCTTCDKQIVSPGNSILYCSEACRRRDASRPISLQSALSTPSSIPSAASYFDLPEPEIIPPRSPTIARPASFYFQEHSPSERSSPDHETDNDDDSETPVSLRFHSQSYTEQQHRQRSAAYRTSIATDGIPSLSHTPSSSVGTAASFDRPLARRYRPLSGGFSAKSIDLVTPSMMGHSPTEQRRQLESASASLASSTSAKTAFRKRSVEEDR